MCTRGPTARWPSAWPPHRPETPLPHRRRDLVIIVTARPVGYPALNQGHRSPLQIEITSPQPPIPAVRHAGQRPGQALGRPEQGRRNSARVPPRRSAIIERRPSACVRTLDAPDRRVRARSSTGRGLAGPPANSRRASGRAVYLYIATFGVTVRICRKWRDLERCSWLTSQVRCTFACRAARPGADAARTPVFVDYFLSWEENLSV